MLLVKSKKKEGKAYKIKREHQEMVNTEYKPKRRDIVYQMAKDLAHPIQDFVVNPLYNMLTHPFTRRLGYLVREWNMLPHTVATLLRRCNEDPRSVRFADAGKYNNTVDTLGFFIGATGVVTQIGIYWTMQDNCPKVAGVSSIWAIPLLTNLASGFYEWQRSARNRLIRHQQQSLEQTVQAPNVETHA